MKNKILMVGTSSYPGGIENCIKNYFLNDIMSEKFDIDFLTYENSLAFSDKISDCGYRILKVPHLKKHPLGYYRALKKIIKSGNYDVVYANMLSCANVLPIKLAKKLGVKIIAAHAHANSTVNGFLRKFLHRKNKKFVRFTANLKLACSENAGKWLFDNDEFIIVPNAIDSKRFLFSEENRNKIRSEYGINENDFLIGHIGRIAVEKNHIFLLNVLKTFIESGKSAYLMLVGDGPLKEEVRQNAVDLGVSDKVIFCGTQSETEKFYSAFDCFVFPSMFEGFGMAVLEAQCVGLKCFASDCLSPSLDVTGTVAFLPLEKGAKFWAEQIEKTDLSLDKEELNEKVKASEFDIDRQIKALSELLNG